MREVHLVLAGAVVLSLVAVSSPLAQQADGVRKRPKQTHDKGVDDAVVQGPADRVGQRQIAGVAIVWHPDGTLVAQLDESFHDAIVAVKNADGTTTYTCLHGLPAASRLVTAPSVPATPALEEK